MSAIDRYSHLLDAKSPSNYIEFIYKTIYVNHSLAFLYWCNSMNKMLEYMIHLKFCAYVFLYKSTFLYLFDDQQINRFCAYAILYRLTTNNTNRLHEL